MKSTKIPDNIWLSASILVFVAGVASSGYQLMKFLETPIPAKLSYIADDAFYYLNVCLNKANLDMWTFDGINPTTGFHLLHAFILVQVIKAFGLFGDNLVIGAVLICFLSFCTSCIIVFLISKKLLGKTYAFLFSGIWMGTLYNIRGALTGMEFGLVLLMTTLFFYMLVELLDSISSDHNKIQHIMKFVSIFFLSFLLCLTRTDLVFLGIASSFALLFSSLFLEPKGSPRALFLRNTGLIIFAGTALSMFTITAFCHAVTGKLIQDSGRIKRIWEHLDATSNMTSYYDLSIIAKNFVRVSGNFLRYTILITYQPLVMILLAALFSLVLIVILRRVKSLKTAPDFKMMTTISLVACCHIFLTLAYYSISLAGLRPHWYYAKIFFSMIFLLIFVIFCFRAVGLSLKSSQAGAFFTGRWIVLPIFLIVSAKNILYTASFEGSWKHQKEAYAAARKLKHLPEDVRIGSWNAGILGYFSGRTIINLDGLINSSIEDYARRCRLDEYIVDYDIGYISDYNRMLTNGVQSRILPQQWSSTHLVVLYSIDVSKDSFGPEGYSIWKVVDRGS